MGSWWQELFSRRHLGPSEIGCCVFVNWQNHGFSNVCSPMEFFSRRRWRLVSAQVVSCCVYELTKQVDSVQRAITKFVWQLGRYEPSPPSTKELYGSPFQMCPPLTKQKTEMPQTGPLNVDTIYSRKFWLNMYFPCIWSRVVIRTVIRIITSDNGLIKTFMKMINSLVLRFKFSNFFANSCLGLRLQLPQLKVSHKIQKLF